MVEKKKNKFSLEKHSYSPPDTLKLNPEIWYFVKTEPNTYCLVLSVYTKV